MRVSKMQGVGHTLYVNRDVNPSKNAQSILIEITLINWHICDNYDLPSPYQILLSQNAHLLEGSKSLNVEDRLLWFCDMKGQTA